MISVRSGTGTCKRTQVDPISRLEDARGVSVTAVVSVEHTVKMHQPLSLLLQARAYKKSCVYYWLVIMQHGQWSPAGFNPT